MAQLSEATLAGNIHQTLTVLPNGVLVFLNTPKVNQTYTLFPSGLPTPHLTNTPKIAIQYTLRPESVGVYRGGFNGKGMLYGTLTATIARLPVGVRKLRVFSYRSGALIREGFCDASGNFKFSGVLEGEEYSIVAYDSKRDYDDIIYSPVFPERDPTL